MEESSDKNCQKPSDLFEFALSSDFSLIDIIQAEELTPNIKKTILYLYKDNTELFEELVSIVLSSFHNKVYKDIFNFTIEEKMIVKSNLHYTHVAQSDIQTEWCAYSKSPCLCVGHSCNQEESFTQPFDLCDGHRSYYRIRNSYLCNPWDKWITNDQWFLHCCCYLLHGECLI